MFNFVGCKGEVKSRYIIKQIKQLCIQCVEEQHLFLGDLSFCIDKLHVYQTAPGAALLARGGLYLFIYFVYLFIFLFIIEQKTKTVFNHSKLKYFVFSPFLA